MYTITNIFWERVNLHIILNKEIEEKVYLCSKTESILLNSKSNEIVINVTNTPEGTMLDAKTWTLSIEDSQITLDPSLLQTLDDKSRNFLYRGKKYAYLVNLYATEELNLTITTKFMIENTKPKAFYNLSETKRLSSKIKIIAKRTLVSLCNIYYKILNFVKPGSKNILFLTENSDSLTWNLKYLYEYLPKDKYKIRIYSQNKYVNKKNYISRIKETTAIALSDIIFVDNYTSILSFLKLSKNVKLIQLWHAGIGFKSVGYARFGLDGSPHPYISCHRKYTDVIVDQPNLIEVYSEVFGVPKSRFKSYGIPRLDNYLDKAKINETTEKLYKINKQIESSKVILFSPTYRGTGSNTAYYDFSLIDLNKIYSFCEDNNFIFIIKMHPFVTEKINIPSKYQNKIYDYSNLDINDLIYISDIMITDYSSCAYEFSLFNRPLIFYRFDKELYEYQRPMHTVDSFTKKQYEVKTLAELMKILDKNKDIEIKDRFKNIKKDEKESSCEKILKDIIGDE